MTGVTTHLEDVHKAFHDLGITRYCFYPPPPRILWGFLTPVVRPERRKTIIAGHSVENDLLALRLFHKRVIGTPWPQRPLFDACL